MDILDKFFESQKLGESNIEIMPTAGLCKDENGDYHKMYYIGAGYGGVGEFRSWLKDREEKGLTQPVPAVLELKDKDSDNPRYQHSYWTFDDFVKYMDAANSHDTAITSVKISESKVQEAVGDLPRGYTDEDLAEFLDKEEAIPPVKPEDEPYDPNDEIIQFVYQKQNDGVQDKINNTFDGGYIDDSSMSTVGEFRNFVCENELDVEDFRIYDAKGEEYHDRFALVYDAKPNLQENCETPGYAHCANCGADLDESNFGGHDNGEDFCKDCWSWQKQGIEESKVSSGNRLHEAVIAGANGLVYSSDRSNTAKENAADNLLRKLGKLPNGQVSKMTESEDNSEIDRFYNTFYELLNKYPEGDDFWREVAEASMGIDFLNEWKKVHPDTTISEEDATKMFQNFIDDRFDI